MKNHESIAIIIGGGPGGLTAGYELLTRAAIKPMVLEMSCQVGGISKTVNYKGNRIDIGGYRFFSKSTRVLRWWEMFLPTQEPSNGSTAEGQQVATIDPESTDKVMLVRNRVSRIFYLGRFFDYPLTLNTATLKSLGAVRVIKILTSYLKSRLFPIKKVKSLEDFFINRFGRELYASFFKDYTEKVWGVPCNKIKPDWGAQRIKGLSISKTLLHALKMTFPKGFFLDQQRTETSLIEKFLYPKYGPGHLWENVADEICQKGGRILLHREVIQINWESDSEVVVKVKNWEDNKIEYYRGNYLFSTMPIKDLVSCLGLKAPAKVQQIAKVFSL